MSTSAHRQPGVATPEWMNTAGLRLPLDGVSCFSPSSCSVWTN
ncbi:hypothetical protein E2I00_018053 [Balaenoptera physalus]|uniref:Uncharacterized protein n=1 Tax=Balaenoptera physalus TaxID=9770 RepID=A0A643BWX7_BALPH|nr:hypothetical protein E2I00_018053 [Balaenoptera physalus]